MIAASPQAWSNGAASTPWAWITALQAWLTFGLVAVICIPALRGIDPRFGWLPFWLVVAPALDLVFLRRDRLAAWTRECVSRLRSRRSIPCQARSWRRRSLRRPQPATAIPATAANQSVMPRRLRSMRRRNSPMMRR
jgi:hypothetical protein